MVLVGPCNSHHTTRAGATLALDGARFVRAKNTPTEWLQAVIKTWMLFFFQIVFCQIYFGASTRRMVLVETRKSHHTTRAGGGARFVRARNTPAEWL